MLRRYMSFSKLNLVQIIQSFNARKEWYQNGTISKKLSWWDLAAGSLLVQEASGLVADFQGNPLNRNSTSCLAATPEMFHLLVPIVADTNI